jgi:hypothetical protein
MFKAKVRLDTQSEVARFVHLVSGVGAPVYLTAKDLKVSGKSLLGALYTMEWDEIWCECEKDIYRLIDDFIIVE